MLIDGQVSLHTALIVGSGRKAVRSIAVGYAARRGEDPQRLQLCIQESFRKQVDNSMEPSSSDSDS